MDSDSSESLNSNFQKPLTFNRLLPYADKLDDEADTAFNEIKLNISKCIYSQNFYDQFLYWLDAISTYLDLYGYRFTKEDHVLLVKLTYHVLVEKELDSAVLFQATYLLNRLLKHRHLLDRADLELDWRPLYQIRHYYSESGPLQYGFVRFPKTRRTRRLKILSPLLRRKAMVMQFLTNKRDWLSQLDDVIRLCSRFFPLSAVQEIWEEFRCKICPVFFKDDPTPEALSSISVFMPVFPNLFDEIKRVYMDAIFDLWHKLCNHTKSEKSLLQHIERFCYHFVGRVDMRPHLDRLFSSLLRILGLPVGPHRAVNSQCKQEGQPDVSSFCQIIIYSIIPGDVGEEVFQRLVQLLTGISSFFHPSNTGQYTNKLNQLLKSLSVSFYNRIARERYPIRSPLPCFGDIPQESRLTDQQVELFVNLLLPHAKMTVIRQSRNYEPLRYLALLRPDIVVPEFLEQLEESIAGELDPHRCTTAIAVMSNLHLPMLESGYGRYPEGRLRVFSLIRSLLPCIDINDPNKFYHVFNCIGNLVLCMRVEDISDKASDSNLTPLEKDVALATSHFEDIFLQLYDSILEVFANLSTNEDMHQERSHRTTKANEENSLFNQIGVISMKLCISNTQSIRRMILDKLINFSFENILDPRVGKELCHLIGAAYQDDLKDTALNLFLPRFIKILDELVADNHVIYKGEPDRYLMWLLSILTGLTNHRMIAFKEQWMHILRSLMSFKHSRISSIFKGIIKYTMMTMTIDSIKLCSSEIYPEDFHQSGWSSMFSFKQFCGMNPSWTKCGDEHFHFVEELVSQILEPILQRWESYPVDFKTFEQRELQCLGHWIVGFLEGGYAVMPRWEDESVIDQLPKEAVVLDLKTTKPLVVNSQCKRRVLTIFGGQNIRKYIIDKGLAILDFSAQQEDAALDAETFRSLVNCIRLACVQEKSAGKDSQGFSSWSNHISSIFKNHLRKNISGGVTWVFKMQAIHLRRYTMFTQPITGTILKCVKSLLPFIGSQYTAQREDAINTAQSICERYLYSAYFLVDYLVPYLDVSNDAIEEHQFQGALECIDKLCSLFELKTSLYLINRLYISVCQAGFSKYCNKLNVRNCYQNVLDNFLDKSYTFTLRSFSPSTKLLSLSDSFTDSFDLFDSKTLCCDNTASFIQQRLALYNDLIVGMLKPFHRSEDNGNEQGNKTTIPWEPLNHTIELLPLQHHVPVPPFVTEFMLNNVFHVVPLVACSSVFTLMAILWTVRYRRRRIEKPCDFFAASNHSTPGVREDNKFLLYDRSVDVLSSEEAWLGHHHITKFHIGYMWWPKLIKIRDPVDYPPFVSHGAEMNPDHLQNDDDRKNFQLITDFLLKDETWTRLQEYMLSIYVNKKDDDIGSHASSKSSDDFDDNNFPLGMFLAAAFKFVGMRCVKQAEKLITRLFDEKSSKREFLQKQGIVALTGTMSGMKDWPREMIQQMMTTVVPPLIKHFIDLEPHHMRDYFSDNLAQLIIRQHMDINIFTPLIQHVAELKVEYLLKYTKENLCLFFELIFAYGCAWRGCRLVHEFLTEWHNYAQHESNKLRRTASLALQIILSSDDTMFGADPKLAVVIITDMLNNQVLPLVAYHICVVLKSKELEPSSVTVDAASRWTFSNNGDNQMAIEDASSNGSSSDEEQMDIDDESKGMSSDQNWKSRIRSMNILQGVMNGILAAILQNSISYPREEFWKLFVYMADLFAVQSREHLKQTIDNCFMVYSNLLVTDDNLQFVIQALDHTMNHHSWKIRVMSLNLMQQLVFNNLYTFVKGNNPTLIRGYLSRLLMDEVLEVRKEAAVTLAGLVQCGYLPVDDDVMQPLYKLSRLGTKRSMSESVKLQRHSGVLGLCALVRAFPREVPTFLPPIIMEVCLHANDPEPIRTTVRETMSSFSKTHHDTWHQQKLLFTDDQLAVLTDLLVSPSYYA